MIWPCIGAGFLHRYSEMHDLCDSTMPPTGLLFKVCSGLSRLDVAVSFKMPP